jgi:creatinine amidohydrolase
MRRDWKDYRAPEFRHIDPLRTIAILPTAAVEQHGPHLPVGTDTIINEGLLAQLKADAPEDLDFRILPVQQVGSSSEHQWAAGALTMTPETALRLWVEIGLSVARAGVQKMLILNSHGGNSDLISIVSRKLRIRAGMYAVRCGWGMGRLPGELYSDHETTYGLHGGDVETSLVLHFRPETVDMTRAQDFRSSAETSLISPVGAVGYGWIASDLNSQGVVGEAHLATAEKGKATAALMVANTIALLRKIEQTPLETFPPAKEPFQD